MKNENGPEKRILVNLLRHLKSKGKEYVNSHYLQIRYFRAILVLRSQENICALAARLQEAIGFSDKKYPIGVPITNWDTEATYYDKINKLSMKERGGLDVEARWYCEANRLPQDRCVGVVKEMVASNCDVVKCFDSFMRDNDHYDQPIIRSDKHKCVLHLPQKMYDTITIEIFGNTTPQNIRDFITANQHTITKWQQKTSHTFIKEAVIDGEKYAITEHSPNTIPNYPWRKKQKVDLYSKIIVELDNLAGKTTYHTSDYLFGEPETLSQEEDKKRMDKIRQIRRRNKTSLL